MGNGAVSHDGSSMEEVLDSPVGTNVQRKPHEEPQAPKLSPRLSPRAVTVPVIDTGNAKNSPRPHPQVVVPPSNTNNNLSVDVEPDSPAFESSPIPNTAATQKSSTNHTSNTNVSQEDMSPQLPPIVPVKQVSSKRLIDTNNNEETQSQSKTNNQKQVSTSSINDNNNNTKKKDVSSSNIGNTNNENSGNYKDVSENDATTAASSTDPPTSSRGKKSDKKDDASRVSNAKSTHTKGGKKQIAQDPVVEDLADDNVSDVSGSEDLEPVEVLQQYIPYYGQGDPANDSIVRSALSGLSVEDIDSKDEYGNTLLLLACQYRCEDLVRIMLNKGADPNAVNASGACGLHFACYRDSSSYNIAKILLQNGANPDIAETSYGCTPLHYSAGNGDLAFCKLLLSYGSQVNTYDYYNYTCVDYAREGSYSDVIDFLQKKLDQVNARQGNTTGTLSNNGLGGANSGHNNSFGRQSSMRMSVSGGATGSGYDDISQWESHTDPETNGKYYIHGKTGECLWEAELKVRMQQYQAAQWSSNNGNTKASFSTPNKPMNNSSNNNQQQQELLLAQALKTQLVAILAKYDPKRLLQLDALLTEYKDREQALYDSLVTEYAIAKDAEFEGLLQKMKESNSSKQNGNNNNTTVTSPGQAAAMFAAADPMMLHELAQETRKKLENQFEEERQTLKKNFDRQLEEEKISYRQIMSEKEGMVVKLQSEVESLQREKENTQQTIHDLEQRLKNVQNSGGQALTAIETELSTLQDEKQQMKLQIASLEQALQIEKDKLLSLENTLSNVTSGQEEMVQREKQAAMERAEQQRLRDEMHARALQEVEERAKQALLKVKSEMNASKNEFIRQERELKDMHENMKASKDREIDSLRRELAERKAQFAQEISAANMKIEDLQNVCEEMTKRAEEAEAFQKMVQEEIAEAKVVQKYNAQLHKDLQREQLARKKLHNEMEDMKGKIRVYVRVRPFSNTERERGCTEAVTRDGKMSVLVKGVNGPDGKKVFDFDQVFGGVEGNNQTDVFKDTKHLIMSVVDGYNVCIFAYGQTGAGKSYTMIGAADIGSCINEQGDFDEQAGITPRAVAELFRLLNERTAQVEYSVEVQMFQLYRDGLEDLLKEKPKKNKNSKNNNEEEVKDPPLKITLAEHSPTGLVHVEGAETVSANTPVEVMRIFARGSGRRTTASTQMNSESSRSHLICSLVVKLKNRRSGQVSVGKLTLVDLAGSERVDKSGATGEQLKEAQSINKSLSALGDVIAALTSNQNHVPYRNHPLTMLMSDSIGGNAKTLMFVNTSPADYNAQESNNSLAFASRCKDITNAVSGGPPGVQAAQVAALKKELAKLKKGPGGAPGGGGGGGGGNNNAAAAGGGRGGGGGGGNMPMGGGMNLARPDTAQQGRAPPR